MLQVILRDEGIPTDIEEALRSKGDEVDRLVGVAIPECFEERGQATSEMMRRSDYVVWQTAPGTRRDFVAGFRRG